MFAFYQEEPVIRYICYLFPLALSISPASSLASVIAILMTAMINANPISAAIPKMSFHHIFTSRISCRCPLLAGLSCPSHTCPYRS